MLGVSHSICCSVQLFQILQTPYKDFHILMFHMFPVLAVLTGSPPHSEHSLVDPAHLGSLLPHSSELHHAELHRKVTEASALPLMPDPQRAADLLHSSAAVSAEV